MNAADALPAPPPGPPDPATPADGDALQAAFDWQVLLWSGEVTPAEQAQFSRWLAAGDAHRRAWQHVSRVGQHLHALPDALTGEVLQAVERQEGRQHGRRHLLRGLALVGGGSLLALGVRQTPGWTRFTADVCTAPGEQRTQRLPDGSRLTLDTASAADLDFGPGSGRIVLRAGALMLDASGPASAGRQLIVETPAGGLDAPGALPGGPSASGPRVAVRHDDGASASTLVQLFEGSLRLRSAGGAVAELHAGEQARFDRHGLSGRQALAANAAAWLSGRLVAEQQALPAFVAELARYRRGVLRCDPALAALRVSGSYPLHDTEAVLDALGRVLPVRVRRLTRYWVDVVPA